MKTITGMNQRELGRKERSREELNKQIRRYKKECKEPKTYILPESVLEKVKNGEIDLSKISDISSIL